MLMAGIALFWVLVDPRRPAAARAADLTTLTILSAANANRPVSLAGEGQKLAHRQCVAAFNNQEEDGILHFGKPEDIARNLAEFAAASCTCLVEQLAERTTTFEFVLAMAMEFSFARRTDYARFNGGSDKSRERVYPAAVKLGLSAKDFDAAGLRAADAVMEAGSACMRRSK